MNTAKTFLLMAVLTVLLILAGNLIGGQGGMMIARLEGMAYGQGASR